MYQRYTDNNIVTVHSNTVSLGKRIGEHVVARAGYLVDAITSASRSDIKGQRTVDGVTSSTARISSATVDGITSASLTDERRHQVEGGLSCIYDFIKKFGNDQNSDNPSTLGVGGSSSVENDYVSNTLSLRLSQDLLERNTTIAATLGRSYDQFRPPTSYTPGLSDEGWNYFGDGKRLTDRISLGITHGITTTTLGSVNAGYVNDRGYLSRPYYVYRIDSTVYDPALQTIDTVSSTFYREHLPPTREMATLSVQLNQYIPVLAGTSVHAEYRLYADTWKLTSHTAGVELYFRILERLTLRPSYRFYIQNSAFFYADTYTAPPRYLTTDFKYRECAAHTAGVKLMYLIRDFIKPADAPLFAMYPTSFTVGADYYMRSGASDPSVRDSHYNYWPIGEEQEGEVGDGEGMGGGFHSLWIQAGTTFEF
jgi:hypothetical protein